MNTGLFLLVFSPDGSPRKPWRCCDKYKCSLTVLGALLRGAEDEVTRERRKRKSAQSCSACKTSVAAASGHGGMFEAPLTEMN